MNEKVLVVDDSLTVRMDLKQAFADAGVPTIECGSIAEARDVLGARSVDILILDVILPDGDGVDFLKEIRSDPRHCNLFVLMLSSEAEVRHRVHGIRSGADEYVGKPYEIDYLLSRCREVLGCQRPPAPSAEPDILLIDDSATFREEMRTQLESSGYQVHIAANGEEGLRLAARIRPQAILVDGVLPGMDGAAVIRRLRLDSALRHIPCLLLTASGALAAELTALESGADGYWQKGDDFEAILARIAALLRQSSGEPSEDGSASLFASKKLLAVDDSPAFLQDLAATLAGEGYNVICARSGEEALELLGVQLVDCILLELAMAGMSGEETCRRIKSAPLVRDIPLIMLTSDENPESMVRGLGAGADDFIYKSSDLEVIKARVRAQLRRKQFEDENRRAREQLLHEQRREAEALAAHRLSEARMALVEQVERKNKELEAFSYSVAHDLRAPLRGLSFLAQVLVEDCAPQLDETGSGYLKQLDICVREMESLIDGLLALSQVSHTEMELSDVDLSELARAIVDRLCRQNQSRRVEVRIEDGLAARGDRRLLQAVLENLLGNAWKYTSKRDEARIEFGAVTKGQIASYFVRDNGAGFSMEKADKLFMPFQRLHAKSEFAGTGVGLFNVQRIIQRHGGRIWTEAREGEGAVFYFTLGSAELQ